VEEDPKRKLRDTDLRALGVDPDAARRYFQRAYGMTFQAYSRSRRLGDAFAALRSGSDLDEVILGHGWDSHSGFRGAFARATGVAPGRLNGATGRGGLTSLGSGIKPVPAEFVRLAWVETPLGPMVAGATESAICLLEFTDRRMLEGQLYGLRRLYGLPILAGESPLLERLREQLLEYFAGERREFDLPLDYPGSAFQRRVWQGLLRIPYGETRSYVDLAREIGAPAAARAVGRANGLNRLAILIPCHRVIAADGGLGGYGGGLWRKLRLLETEGGLSAQPG
jgi:AraC family transcriptional regulator of adaptative response/methylated-DNA-[protein]-cysteine methyltransferase